MAAKFAVVLCVTLCAAVAYGLLSVDVSVNIKPSNNAEKLLHQLAETVNKALTTGQQELDDAVKKLNDTAAAVKSRAESQIKEIEQKLQQEIEKLREKAKQAAVNVDSCIKGGLNELQKLPGKLVDDLVHCVTDPISEAISYAEDAISKLQDIVDIVNNLSKEVNACGSGLSSVKCQAKLALNIEEDIITLPLQIASDVASAVSLISQLKPKIETCAALKVSQMTLDGGKIVSKTATCVASKIIK